MWFLSLSLSLVCALAATSVQYWARNYTRSIERFQQSTHKRALIRALMFEGLEKSHMSEIVDTIPILIHIALFLFLTGLVTFLYEISLPIAYFVLSILAFCTLMYGVAATLPLFHTQSTLRTPFSSTLWYISHYFSRVLPSPKPDSAVIEFSTHPMRRVSDPEERSYIKFLESKFVGEDYTTFIAQSPPQNASTQHLIISISKAQEQLASVDGQLHYTTKKRMVRALTWIHGLINEDRELEAFLSAIPGLSMWESSLLYHLVERDPQLLADIRKFFHRTIPYPWASGERGQKTRAIACMEAMYHLTGAVSSPMDWGLMGKIHQVPLLFVSDLAPYLQYCDKKEISLVFCTMTACLNLRESTLAATTRNLDFYPDLDQSRQTIDKLLQFKIVPPPGGRTRSPHDPSATDAGTRPLSPFEFVICTIIPELSCIDDRVSAYKHTLKIFEAVWQSVQGPRARFHQSTFVNLLDKLLVEYSGNIKEPEPMPTKYMELLLSILEKMLETLLKATRFLDDTTAIKQAISAVSNYVGSNPSYGIVVARTTLRNLKRKMRSGSEENITSQKGTASPLHLMANSLSSRYSTESVDYSLC